MTRRPFRRAPLARLGAVAALVALAGCNTVVMNPAGDVARQQSSLIVWSTVLMLLIIVPVMALTVLFAWRYREGAKDAKYEPDWDHSTGLELVIWAAPLLIIIALGALTWVSTHLLDPYRPLDRVAAGRPWCRSTGNGCSSTPSRGSRRSTSWWCRSTVRCGSA